MSLPYNAIMSGTYTSNGTSQTINLPADITKFEVFNLTYFGSTAASTDMETAMWISGLSNGSAYVGNKTNGAATIALTSMITTGGFSYNNPTSTAVLSAGAAITAATNANPVVVSTGSTTGLSDGDTIRYINATGQLNLSGIDWTIDTVVANTSFNLPYVGAAPGAAATGGSWKRVNINSPYYPRSRVITAITKAASAVITMSVTHGFTVGQVVAIVNIDPLFGMPEINGLTGSITAINTTTNTITVNINSTGFTTFARPTSAQAAAAVSWAQVVPVGETATSTYANLLDDATVNQSAYSLTLGASVVGASTSSMMWIAYRSLVVL